LTRIVQIVADNVQLRFGKNEMKEQIPILVGLLVDFLPSEDMVIALTKEDTVRLNEVQKSIFQTVLSRIESVSAFMKNPSIKLATNAANLSILELVARCICANKNLKGNFELGYKLFQYSRLQALLRDINRNVFKLGS
jgi:hypothetical protein